MTSPRVRGSLLSLFWTPLVAVGATGPRGPNLQISVSTFGASIVPDRPRLLCVLYKANYTHELVQASGAFAVSVLGEEQTALLPSLGMRSGRDVDKLHGLDITTTPGDAPALNDALGWLDCRVIEAFDLGDATAFLAAVTHVEERRDGAPMTWSQVRRMLPEAWQQQWDRKIAVDIERSRGLMSWPSE